MLPHTHTHTHTHSNTHRHTQTHTDTHRHTQTHTQTHIYRHSHTSKQAQGHSHALHDNEYVLHYTKSKQATAWTRNLASAAGLGLRSSLEGITCKDLGQWHTQRVWAPHVAAKHFASNFKPFLGSVAWISCEHSAGLVLTKSVFLQRVK